MGSHGTAQRVFLFLASVAATAAVALVWYFSSVYNWDEHRVDWQHEAGTVSVAVTMVAPWENYIDSLLPNFKLDGETALEKVVRPTATFETKVLEQIGGTIAGKAGARPPPEPKPAGQPEAKPAAPAEGKTGGGAPDQAAGRSGQAPPKSTEAPQQGSGERPHSEPAAANPETTIEPMLQYMAATALFQEVQFLKNYVRDAAVRRGVKVYVVRLSIDVVPFARNQPYDAYAYISFFAEYRQDPPAPSEVCSSMIKALSQPEPHGQSPAGTLDLVEVIPLLVTDSFERVLESRSFQAVQKFAAAVSLAAPELAGNVDLSRLRDEIQKFVGSDLNSLLSIGRFTDNTIHARLGAARRGNTHAMIPQNHNVTLLVEVPSKFVEHPPLENIPAVENIPTVRVVAKTVLRHATKGDSLPHQAIADRITAVSTLLPLHFPDGVVPRVTGICPKDKTSCTDPGQMTDQEQQQRIADHLLKEVFANNFSEFQNAIACLKLHGWKNFPFPRDFWVNIVETLGRSEFSGVRFDLPIDRGPRLPEKQPILLVDDGAKEMTVKVRGGEKLTAAAIAAVLTVSTTDGHKLSLPAQNVVTDGGSDPTIVFPSLAAMKANFLDPQRAQPVAGKLDLTFSKPDHWGPSGPPVTQSYDPVYYQRRPAESSETTKQRPDAVPSSKQ